jgi:hypothetical protein
MLAANLAAAARRTGEPVRPTRGEEISATRVLIRNRRWNSITERGNSGRGTHGTHETPRTELTG